MATFTGEDLCAKILYIDRYHPTCYTQQKFCIYKTVFELHASCTGTGVLAVLITSIILKI